MAQWFLGRGRVVWGLKDSVLRQQPHFRASECPYLTPFRGWPIIPSMSTDDNDFPAARAMAEFGYGLAFSLAALVVAPANDLNPPTFQTEQ